MDSQQSACSSTWKGCMTVCICTNSSIRHWSGTFQNDCSLLPRKRTSASESSAQEKWWGKAYSPPVAYWLAAPWETGLCGVVPYNILDCVNNALPAQLPAPVETRQFVDDFTTMSVANSEDDVTHSICSVALELRDEIKKREAHPEHR